MQRALGTTSSARTGPITETPLRDQIGPWKVRVAALPFLKVNTLNGMHARRTHELFCCSGINRVYVLKPSQQ